MAPTDAELATQTLTEEGNYRFPSFSASDAVTLVSCLQQPVLGLSPKLDLSSGPLLTEAIPSFVPAL